MEREKIRKKSKNNKERDKIILRKIMNIKMEKEYPTHL